MSNRMYSVFPRRNMRLRNVSHAHGALYPQVDFSSFRYVSAMIRKLKEVDAEAYKVVLAEQQSAWLARMLELLQDIEAHKTLLWIKRAPIAGIDLDVTKNMVDVLFRHVDRVLTIPVAAPKDHGNRLTGFRKETGWMARDVHVGIAMAVSVELQAYQQQKRPA